METTKHLTFRIGGELEINRLGYGGMRLTGPGVWGDVDDRENAKKVLRTAVEGSVNFIDTAEAYGPYTNETLIAEALHPYRKGLVIATKSGLDRIGPSEWQVNGRPERIIQGIEGSLKRLKVEQIDLWQLHRIDPNVPVEETLGPVADAVKAGKIRFVGLSEVNIAQIEQAEKVIPIVSIQNMYNLGERKWEELVDYTAKRNMAFIPWYPLAAGPGKLEEKIVKIAAKHKATTAQVALAWLLKRSPNILLIPGTGSVAHLKENLGGANVSLSDADFEELSA
ncbi:MAG: aldo/keto reductase [Bacteroidetes bacterium]|nr:aldo/keto reductase [Bacteroidota bacterium]